MKGKNQGVQKRLLDINPRAYYTPCSYHNLNLVLGDMANSCTRAVSFFGVLQHIYSLFSSLTKRWKILQENVCKFSVKSLSQTRWECRIESVKAIKFQAQKIKDAAVQSSKTSEDPKIKSEVICLATYEIENFEFLLGMNIWYDILFYVNSVSKIMQSEDMHIDVTIDHLRGLITYLKNYRENGFASALESTKEMTIEMDIEPKFNEKCKIHRKKHFDDIISGEIAYFAEDSFRVDHFLLNGLAMLSVESKMLELLDYRTLINNFTTQKARKIT
ncbi:hypothetical protein GmHk_20G057756 [Glycine max]|nr:hypothetical protein GmHk_20G057756 [Glycine max]